MHKYYNSLFTAPFALLLFLLALFTYNAPGTGDFKIWLIWMDLLKNQGLYSTLLQINDNYPPFSLMLLDAVVHVAGWTGLSAVFWLKMSLFTGLFASCLIFHLWQRNLGLTIGLYLALLVNVGCGYLDVYWTPTVIAALWALERQKLTLAAALYTLSVMTKPQPMLLAPFLALYVLEIRAHTEIAQLPWKQIRAAAVGTIGMLALFVCFPGWASFSPLINAMDSTGQHWGSNLTLSGNAMNVNWIITHFLHVCRPDLYGPLDRGTAICIGGTGLAGQLPSKLAFVGVFLFVLYRFFRQEKTFRSLLLYSALGALTCLMLNTGMHENHLYVVPVVTVALAALDTRYRAFHLAWTIAAAMNLLVFYGVGGAGTGYSRVVGVDLPLLFSIVYMLLYLASLGLMFVHDDASAPDPKAIPASEPVPRTEGQTGGRARVPGES